MGSHSIEVSFKGKLTPAYIHYYFKKLLIEEREQNGHRDGYSGDFQTVEGLDLSHLGEIYPDRNAAVEFGLDVTEKWGPAVVLYYKWINPETNRANIRTLIVGWAAA